ncbi:MAG TPA: hypothetical protein DDW78_02690 [Treponema sp.]|nr:hypothetical protein [Treponema sp.]
MRSEHRNAGQLLALLLASLLPCACTKASKGFSVRLAKDGELPPQAGVIYNDEEFLKEVEAAERELAESGGSTSAPEESASYSEDDYSYTPLEVPEGDTLEIGDKLFLTQINDMYFNFDSYKEKTIIVEGMFTEMVSWDGEQRYPAVYRRGPGCCGNDGWGGFLLRYDGTYPKYDEWIRVTGTPMIEHTQDGYDNIYLVVSSLEVKQERGLEFVVQ